jgi:flagellar basal-body rod protein FlgB
MINRLTSDDMMELVHNALDAASLQHMALSNNIANVDTPGFKRSEVAFSEKLKRAIDEKSNAKGVLNLARTDSKHIGLDDTPDLAGIKPELVQQVTTSFRNDQNNVDIDVEMAKLAQNTVIYQALAQIKAGQYSTIKSAIKGS